jgi:aminopeptidase N
MRALLCVALWAYAAPDCPARSGPDLSHPTSSIARCVQQALAAVNTHHPQAVAGSTTGEGLDSFRWVSESTTPTWSVGVLKAPGGAGTVPGRAERQNGAGTDTTAAPAPTYLAVFYAWHTCQSDGDHVHPLTLTSHGWRLGPEIPETDLGGFRVRDHDLHVAIDAPRHMALLSDRVQIERIDPAAPPYCLLRLSEIYHMQSVTCNGRAVPFQQEGGVLIFAPPAGRTFTVGLRYSGVAHHGDGDYIEADEATLNSYWYPHIARQPATATITVTAPPGWIPVAQGEPVQQSRSPEGATTVTYRNDLPVCWFTVDMGRYHASTRLVEGRKLTAYLLRDDPMFAKRCLDVLAQALHCYDSCFARFPYTRYGLVETRGNLSGALEAYSFATFSARDMLENIPHELSHTWWGGLIPCTYMRSMWDEGFADYSEQLFRRLEAGETSRIAAPAAHKAYGNHFDAYTLADAHDTSDGRQSGVGYGKGSLVLRVLEEQIGRETLLKCMARFVADHPRGEAAEWPEFEQAVDRVTGDDYRWFFAQWLERKGLPTLRLIGLTIKREGTGYRLAGDLLQAGTPYRLRVPLLLRTADGGFSRRVVEVSDAETHFELHSESAPQRLTLDPDNALPLTAADGTTHDFTLREE